MAESVEEGGGKSGMRVIEILFTFIIIVGIIYTAIPCALSVYCFVIIPHMDNNDVCAEGTIVTGVETEQAADIPLSPPAYVNHQLKSMEQLQTMLYACNRNRLPSRENHDCSNFAAYTEYYLENRGFNTTISASFSEAHAWVTVHNIIGHNKVHVECIPPAHISHSLGPIEQSYNDIHDALAGKYPYEFDWWSA